MIDDPRVTEVLSDLTTRCHQLEVENERAVQRIAELEAQIRARIAELEAQLATDTCDAVNREMEVLNFIKQGRDLFEAIVRGEIGATAKGSDRLPPRGPPR